jgi:hypothetical protein
MSIEVDSVENENTLIADNQEIIKLLKAILLGIELMSDAENLLDRVE